MAATNPSAVDEYNRRAERSGWSSRFDSTLAFEAVELREALAVWRAACNGQRFPARAVYLTGEIIHNPHVNEKLRTKGIQFLTDDASSVSLK